MEEGWLAGWGGKRAPGRWCGGCWCPGISQCQGRARSQAGWKAHGKQEGPYGRTRSERGCGIEWLLQKAGNREVSSLTRREARFRATGKGCPSEKQGGRLPLKQEAIVRLGCGGKVQESQVSAFDEW